MNIYVEFSSIPINRGVSFSCTYPSAAADVRNLFNETYNAIKAVVVSDENSYSWDDAIQHYLPIFASMDDALEHLGLTLIAKEVYGKDYSPISSETLFEQFTDYIEME